MRSFRSARSSHPLRTLVVAGSVGVAALLAGTAPAYAGVPNFTVTPNPVAPGGTLTISGISCTGSGAVLSLELFTGDESGTNQEPDGPTVDTVDLTPSAGGAWSGTMTAPSDAVTGDKLTVWARCSSGDSHFDYENEAVTVLAPGGTTTTTSAGVTTTTTPAAATTSTTVAAAPATAVAASPSYTG